MSKKDKTKIKQGFNFNILLLILLPLVLIGTTIAKYIQEESLETQYHAKNFYFGSDLLTDTTEIPEYSYERGINTIFFYLQNNDDSLRYSEVDIDYVATISKDNNIVDTKQGTIEKGAINLEKVEFTNLEEGEYIVTATSTSPYEKTLTGKFILSATDQNVEYEIIDTENNSEIKMIINTIDYSGNVSITYPDGVVPDMTDSKIISSEDETKTIDLKFEANSSYTVSFFKTNPANTYTKSDFILNK